MKLSKMFTRHSPALHWQGDEMELAIIPDLNTVRVNSRLFKFDAALSDITFNLRPEQLRYGAGSIGFSCLLPPEPARLMLERWEAVVREKIKTN